MDLKNCNVMLDAGAYLPERAFDSDAGADLRTPREVVVPPHGNATVDTGVHVQIPEGYVGMIKTKSGINLKKDITTEGVIDAGYTGCIIVKLYNHGNNAQIFKAGDKITQLVIEPIATPGFTLVEELEETERGNNGFGSTGV